MTGTRPQGSEWAAIKAEGFMSGVAAYGNICRWVGNKTVMTIAMLLLYGSVSIL